jgi:hypothetical protein
MLAVMQENTWQAFPLKYIIHRVSQPFASEPPSNLHSACPTLARPAPFRGGICNRRIMFPKMTSCCFLYFLLLFDIHHSHDKRCEGPRVLSRSSIPPCRYRGWGVTLLVSSRGLTFHASSTRIPHLSCRHFNIARFERGYGALTKGL